MANAPISQSETLLDKMVEAIVEVAKPDKINLFSSRAKGTAREDSDYDFIVVQAEAFFKEHSRRKEAGKLGRALAKFRVPKDILMYSAEEVEQRRHWQDSVFSDALKEGKALYEQQHY